MIEDEEKASDSFVHVGTSRYKVSWRLDVNGTAIELCFEPLTADGGIIHSGKSFSRQIQEFKTGGAIHVSDVSVIDLPIYMRKIG